MKKNKTDRILLGISIGGFAVLAISFMLMPVDGLGFAPGILFWSGLIIGVVLQIVLESRRSSLFAKYKVKRETMQKARNGLLSFGSNRFALVADISLVVSLVATILSFILTKGTGYLCYLCLALLVFSFCMHCILNGRIYIYIKNQNKVRQVLEERNGKKEGEGKI